MKNTATKLTALLCILCLCAALFGCTGNVAQTTGGANSEQSSLVDSTEKTEGGTSDTEKAPESTTAPTPQTPPALADIPAYSGDPFIVLNDGKPYFSESDYTTKSYEYYGPLDSLGRCTVVHASIGRELMPTEERGSIGSVKPSGWHTVKYDCVDGKYLYNRAHLIGWQLTGENANKSNLITGTRYLNIEGMLPFENMIADYVKETSNHVLYRVTPMFYGDDLVARGVLMEAYSVEDKGEGVEFCIFAYNVQPNIKINYADGTSSLIEGTPAETTKAPETEKAPESVAYILNTSTKKFHYPDCRSVAQMSEKNKLSYKGTRDEVISDGYSACGICKP